MHGENTLSLKGAGEKDSGQTPAQQRFPGMFPFSILPADPSILEKLEARCFNKATSLEVGPNGPRGASAHEQKGERTEFF